MAVPKISAIFRSAARFEELVLGLLLTTMIVLACLQIALRFFDSGLPWADPLLRYLVLWSGLLGAAMCTSRGSHIALDLAGYLLPPRLQPLVQFLCNVFSLCTAGFLTWASYLFIRNEMEFGESGLLAIPSWGWNLIFPLAFTLITVRYLLLLIRNTRWLLGRHDPQPGAGQ